MMTARRRDFERATSGALAYHVGHIGGRDDGCGIERWCGDRREPAVRETSQMRA